MNYTASSVKKALENSEKNKIVYSEGLDNLRCPVADLILEDGQLCGGRPKDCLRAQAQSCLRRVKIYRGAAKNLAPLAILKFKFTISAANTDGFIDKDDSTLRLLIVKKLLAEEMLNAV